MEVFKNKTVEAFQSSDGNRTSPLDIVCFGLDLTLIQVILIPQEVVVNGRLSRSMLMIRM